MREIDFYNWLKDKNTPSKRCSDFKARVKKVENCLKDCNLDMEYKKDKCVSLLRLFDKTGQNIEMKERHIGGLPIGDYHLASYKYSVNKYIDFLNATVQEQK